ncbi:hypothetical protein L3Y34_012432 [Caenorhabditis briggsae]|uniref:Uncharacterized protein n=1 Tax=Caenorhabditis briggsae TaxID=6238 RepID=A0AAE8ZU26_CAEBR|nr:hypothetical protein L3Y34_012432 [Caenorhabditis briggsae]
MLVIIDIEPSPKFDELVKFMVQNSIDFHVTHRSVGMQKESQIKKTEIDEEQYSSPDSIESTQMENVVREKQPLEENQLEPITTLNRFEPTKELGSIPSPFLTQAANGTSRNMPLQNRRGTCELCKKRDVIEKSTHAYFQSLDFQIIRVPRLQTSFSSTKPLSEALPTGTSNNCSQVVCQSYSINRRGTRIRFDETTMLSR